MSFMYTKPPGLDAALARDAEMEKKVGGLGGGGRKTRRGAGSGYGGCVGRVYAVAGTRAASAPLVNPWQLPFCAPTLFCCRTAWVWSGDRVVA